MIHRAPHGLWVHSQDLMVDVPGRADSAEEKANCAQFLSQREQRATHTSAIKAQSAIAAAHIRSFVVSRPVREVDSEQLAAVNQAIDRLLAFVPARAAALSDERLNSIADSLATSAEGAFGEAARVFVAVAPENDPETEACHRLSIRVVMRETIGSEATARGIVLVHRQLAAIADAAERHAILLVVNPESSSRESERQS